MFSKLAPRCSGSGNSWGNIRDTFEFSYENQLRGCFPEDFCDFPKHLFLKKILKYLRAAAFVVEMEKTAKRKGVENFST